MQEIRGLLADLDSLIHETADETAKREAAEAHKRAEHRRKIEAELARHEALEALRKKDADQRSRERQTERELVNVALSDAGLFDRPERRTEPTESPILSPSLRDTIERWRAAHRGARTDNFFPEDDDPTDKTFPDELPASWYEEGKSHYRSPERDRRFFREISRRSERLGHPYRGTVDPVTGKARSSLLRSFRNPFENSNASDPSSPDPTDRKFPATPDTPTPYRKAPEWRDLTDGGRAIYGIEAARASGAARSITIRLGDVLKVKAEAKPDALRYLMKHINRALEKRYGKAPPMFVTAERSDGIGLHLHGIIELEDRHRKTIAEVIREAVGATNSEAHKQVRIRPIYSRGWGTYITKHAPSFRGSASSKCYYMSRGLRNRAESIHSLDRLFINETGGLYGVDK